MGKRLVAGLGNPGREYHDTRHNVGFRVVDELARRLRLGPPRLECNALLYDGPDTALAQPQTYMNRSGYALRCLAERHGLTPQDMLIVYDEVQLPLGKLRFRGKGSSGGHRGMASVIHNLRTEEVPRLRLGVGPEAAVGGEEIVDYVLGPFTAEERGPVEEMLQRAAEACLCWLQEGAEVVMRRFNA